MIAALRDPSLPVADTVIAKHAQLFPELAALACDEQASTAELLVLRTPTTRFAIALTAAPLAWSELLGPCDAAWYWPEAAASLRPHAAQLSLTAENASGDAIDMMLALTRVTAAVADVAQALGIYLRGARQVHKVEDFVSEAQTATREQLPLYLWVRFSISEESDATLTLATSGMVAFELMEVEFPHCSLDAQTLMDRAFNIAHYLLERGPVLAHGHTIGISATEKFRVSHVRSLRGDALVYRLEQT
jgi:hypothetical protein